MIRSRGGGREAEIEKRGGQCSPPRQVPCGVRLDWRGYLDRSVDVGDVQLEAPLRALALT